MLRSAWCEFLLLPACAEPEPAAPGRFTTPTLSVEDGRIDDFEVRPVSWEAWHAVLVEGRTRADFALAEGGATPASGYHLAADLVRPENPEPADVAGVIARLADGQGRDVSGFDGIELWLRATPGTYIVQLGSARISDFDHFNGYVEVRAEGWERYRLPFSAFGQEGFGEAVAWTGRDVTHLAVFGLAPGSSTLALDDVRFYREAP